ncbi:hypothetical protein ACFONC_13930 [Luteimonas soli]|uniref:Dicarboxylate transport domain-containing protein n=1 Tax=Luteimonas soli TaxID=1648966 RepID=A0ABV7XN12_9GAMM
MPRAILHLLPLLLLASVLPAQARTMTAKIERVTTAVVTLEGVEVRLDWPAQAATGELRLRAGRVDAADLGYHFQSLEWRCPLARDGQGGWQCDGELHAAGGKSFRLSVALASGSTDAALSQGDARFALHRSAATPDDTVLDLARVPVAWVQALSSQAWSDGRLTAGTVDGQLAVRTPANRPLRVDGTLALAGGALETPDGSIAAEQLGGRFRIDYRKPVGTTLLALDGELRGGQFLYGTTYVVLPETPVPFALDALGDGARGWSLSSIQWRDGEALVAQGSAAFGPDASLKDLDIELRSGDLPGLAARYLSGWLAIAGLPDLSGSGALDARVRMADGRLASVDARLHDISLDAAGKGLAFAGLDGDVRLSGSAPVDSELRWRSGSLQGIEFGAATLPWRSADGALRSRAPVAVPMLGGQVRFDGIVLQPPAGDEGLRIGFGLALQGLQLGELSQSLGGPAFRGTLDGTIPVARYAGDRLDFDGGLSMQVFDGRVEVTSLSMERPFGVAPTLSADFALHDLDLLAITEVFDFGSISGRLDGRIDDLRLVDWSPVAFDAELHTVRRQGVRQRISQRAVQNISSVGDASFAGSLQARLIGLFDDFGYSRIGISCRLANQVCAMGGLHSAGDGFTIVEGAGIPRLDVVGFNRNVDWPTLVERLAAVGSGDVKPVFE